MREALVFGPKVTLTREELYDKVWSTPMQKIEVKFGVSDSGLVKLCRCYQIPVRGYWARIQAGQTAKRTPLPLVKEAMLNTVEICVHERQPPEQRTVPDKYNQLTVSLRERRATGRRMEAISRAYNEGVAFR